MYDKKLVFISKTALYFIGLMLVTYSMGWIALTGVGCLIWANDFSYTNRRVEQLIKNIKKGKVI